MGDHVPALDFTNQAARRSRILVVDDLVENRRLLAHVLAADGYEVTTASDAIVALEIVARETPDLVITDVDMPGPSGVILCRQLKENPRTRLVPTIVITGLTARTQRLAAIEAGADDFIGKPFDTTELRARVRSLLRLKHFTDELDSAESVILSLAMTVEARDPYTFGHCQRMSGYARLLGARLGLTPHELSALHKGGYLHDVGKIGIPDAVLFKSGPLTADEFETVKRHTTIGDRLCGNLRSLDPVRPIIRSHHERIDGSGYPDSLAGGEVPLLAQIVSVVDLYDAMTTTRPYRSGLQPQDALAALGREAERGRFDRALIEAFVGFGPDTLVDSAQRFTQSAAAGLAATVAGSDAPIRT